MTLLLALLLSASTAPSVGVAREMRAGRPVVHVLVAGALKDVRVAREGPEVIITVGGTNEGAPPPAPPPQAPIEDIHVERWDGGLRVRIAVDPDVPYEIERGPDGLSVVFQAPPTARASQPLTAELYPLLFPLPPGEPAGNAGATEESGASSGSAEGPNGLVLGPLTIQPALATSYSGGTVGPSSGGTPPSRGHYWQIIPRVTGLLPVRTSVVRTTYEAHIRPPSLSTFDLIEPVSHIVDVSTDWVATPRLNLNLADHYARGALEVSEVDPGSEYFYDLARFTHNEASARAHYDFGTRLGLQATGSLGRVRFAAPSSFFDYDARALSGGLTYEVSYETRATLSARFAQTLPGAQRPEARLRQKGVNLEINGRVAPLTNGRAAVGWTFVDSPNAGPGGRHDATWTATAGLKRDVGYSTSVSLDGLRGVFPSGFENNGFYVATGAELGIRTSLPLGVSFRGGSGYHVNSYRTPAVELGVPRHDRILRWSVGLGRPVTRWGYLRLDYRWDRRDSNLDQFDFTNKTLLLQLGVGLFGSQPAQ